MRRVTRIFGWLRRAFVIGAPVLGAALLVGGGTLWCRSYYRADEFGVQAKRWTPDRWTFARGRLHSEQGRCRIGFDLDDTGDPEWLRYFRKMPIGPTFVHKSRPAAWATFPNPGVERWWYRLGFALRENPYREPTRISYMAGFPHWMLLLIGGVSCAPAAAGVRPLQRRRRRRQGLCETCGYDLRASPDRCPECGNLPSPAGRGSG